MFPGTALGVLFGDVVYTVMAIRLARRTGRIDVTAMPLGLDAPSTIGMALTVLGPAFVVAKARMPAADAAILAWQVGMATMVLMGVFKLVMSFIGDRIRRAIPEAGLLGSIGGVGIALLGTLQLGEIYGEPIVGMMALGVILYALVAKIRLPFRAPEVLASVVDRRRALLRARRARTARCIRVAVPAANFPVGLAAAVVRVLARDADRGARLPAARAAVRDPDGDRRHQRHRERAHRRRRLRHARHPARPKRSRRSSPACAAA